MDPKGGVKRGTESMKLKFAMAWTKCLTKSGEGRESDKIDAFVGLWIAMFFQGRSGFDSMGHGEEIRITSPIYAL